VTDLIAVPTIGNVWVRAIAVADMMLRTGLITDLEHADVVMQLVKLGGRW
jgi:hypothetical protein